MKKLVNASLLLATLAFAPLPAYSQQNHNAHHPSGAAQSADMADAEVRRIDKAANKITLRHGEIKSLDMPPMTMVFQVKDAAMLDSVQPGDKVKFRAEKIGGAYTVTAIEAVK
jgi:Cu(I)/Ag(I) efflux system protein CusF